MPRAAAASRPAARKARAAARAAAAATPAPPGRTQRIVDSITTAIVERRLMPGTKLAEQQIADIFGCRARSCARRSTSSAATGW